MGERKYVQLAFLVGFMLAAYLLVQATDWLWGYFQKPDRLTVNAVGILLALGLTWYFYRSESTQQGAGETVAELRKVTWPTRKETSQATVVVIIFVLIAAIFLQAFDFFWSKVTSYILG
jgi:preprotein translocase subunit SecE